MILNSDTVSKIRDKLGADFALNECLLAMEAEEADKGLPYPVNQLACGAGFAKRLKKQRDAMTAVNQQIQK